VSVCRRKRFRLAGAGSSSVSGNASAARRPARPFANPDNGEISGNCHCGVTRALSRMATLHLQNPNWLSSCTTLDRYYVMLRAFEAGPVYYLSRVRPDGSVNGRKGVTVFLDYFALGVLIFVVVTLFYAVGPIVLSVFYELLRAWAWPSASAERMAATLPLDDKDKNVEGVEPR
jgi:hypothetical protein